MNLIPYIIIFILIVVLVFILRKSDVREIVFGDRFKLKFWKPCKAKIPEIIFNPCYNFDFIISKDGEIYKNHLVVTAYTNQPMIFNNWNLEISKMGKFIFKQYFRINELGNRKGIGKHLDSIPKNKQLYTALEFEPEKNWEPTILKERVYKAKLILTTTKNKYTKRFYFRVRKQNIQAIENIKKEISKYEHPQIVSVPIIK